MALTLYGYVAIHIATGVGISIITGVILALLSRYAQTVYAFLINRLLGVELEYPTDKNSLVYATIKIDGLAIKSKKQSAQKYFLWFITTVTCTLALMVLYEGCILGNAGVYIGSVCPNDPMTCFASSDNANSAEVGTFECTPGNQTTFPAGTDKAWCYGWIITRQTVSTVINQIGICGGILTVCGTLFAFMFRSTSVGTWQKGVLVLLMFASIIAILLMIAISVPLHVSFSVLAYLVVFEIFMLFLTAYVFESDDEEDDKIESPAPKPVQITPVPN